MQKFLNLCCKPRVIASVVFLLAIALVLFLINWNALLPYVLISLPVIAVVVCILVCPLAMVIMAKQMKHSSEK